MADDYMDGLGRMYIMLAAGAILAAWKLIDIAIWIFHHVSVGLK